MPVQNISMLDNIILIDINGVEEDWKTYKIKLNIENPGEKTFVFRFKSGVDTIVKPTARGMEGKAEMNAPDNANSMDCDALPTTATKCRVLRKIAYDTTDSNNDSDSLITTQPLHTIGYHVRPITGPTQTIEQIFEQAQKRARLD